jgi:hypothetical protein
MKRVGLARACAVGRRLSTAVDRLGSSDGVVALNVNGETFTTLRSTASLSPTLRRHLVAAEANAALLKDGAVFIDRDAETFEAVLTHLRNKAGGVSRPGAARSLGVVSELTVELDTMSPIFLRGLWTEAAYYELPELVQQVDAHHKTIGMMRRAASADVLSLFKSLQRASLVAGALGLSWHVGSQDVNDSHADASGADLAVAKFAKVAKAILAVWQ